MTVGFRSAEPGDCGLVLAFIRELAEYEKMSEKVMATEELLHEWLFERRVAEAIFVLSDGLEVGFALYFHNFSTFLGKGGVYLEDLYVKPQYRGRGLGRALISRLAAVAVERGCGRLDWMCLDWNAPSIAFYRSLGAEALDDWTTYRLEGTALQRAAQGGVRE